MFSVPASQIIAGSNIFEARVNFNKGVSDMRLVLPLAENKLNIKFYPEGGNLVHATQSTVGWEAKNADGSPLKATGLLLKDNKVIDTIETDSYGMGTFKLVPILASNYKVRLLGETKDTTYTLPNILPKGPVISIKNAISNDTLRIRLTSKIAGKYYVMVHNYRQVFFSFPAEIGAAGKTILINLEDVPKGLSEITVLDSMQRPLAERSFFAHYDKRTPVDITTDRLTYSTRQKVHLKLRLRTPNGDAVKGVVSVACIQSNRMEIKKAKDIESYFYLEYDLGALPLKEKYMGESDDERAYLERILLIKGWIRYRWTELQHYPATDTIIGTENINSLEGAVTKYGKALKKPVKLLLMTDSITSIIVTNSRGEFNLDRSKIIIAEDRKGHLLLENNSTGEYTISLKDRFSQINTFLTKEFVPTQYDYFSKNVITTSSSSLNGMDHVINLKEVKIKALKDENFSQFISTGKPTNSNECGDYVCEYNILNCTNHRYSAGNHPPIIGQVCKQVVDGKLTEIIYAGCQVFANPEATIFAFRGINYAKEFYGSDYAQYDPPEPEYLSTIYWKHLCFVNSNGDADLSFYTSDITGPFKIVVQGLTQNDVIYGEKAFNVTKASQH